MVVLFCLGCLLGGIALCFNGRLCYRDLHCAQHAIHAYLVVYALARKGLKIHGIGTDELTNEFIPGEYINQRISCRRACINAGSCLLHK